jgi:uncharacterized delta-60 repeat protein
MKSTLFTLALTAQLTHAADLTGLHDTSFNVDLDGGWVHRLAVQPDDKILIIGDFTEVNGVPRKTIARLGPNGQLDATFEINNLILPYSTFTSLNLAPDGKILLTGGFSNFAGVEAHNIVRLTSNGAVDSSFRLESALTGGAFPPTIYSTAFQPDGKIVIGGSFERIGRTFVKHVARLLPDGTIDRSFITTHLSNAVHSVAVQADGKILAGAYDKVMRLNTDGSLDTDFANPNRPAGGAANILLLPDGGSLISGFSDYRFNGLTTSVLRLNANGSVNPNLAALPPADNVTLLRDRQNRILVGGAPWGANNGFLIRLNPDGSRDHSLGFETRAERMRIHSAGLQSNGRIIASFSQHNLDGVTYTPSLSRFFETNATSVLFFHENHRYAMELSTNITFTLRRAGNLEPPLTVNYSTQDDSAHAGVDYVAQQGALSFAPGEREKQIQIDLIDDPSLGGPSEVEFQIRVQPVGSALDPNNTPAVAHIREADWLATIEFQWPEVAVHERNNTALAVVRRPHAFSFNGDLMVDYHTEDGTARAGVDYQATSGTMAFSGYQGPGGLLEEWPIEVPLYTNAAAGPRSFKLHLTNPRIKNGDRIWHAPLRVHAALDQNATTEFTITHTDLWLDKSRRLHSTSYSGFTLESSIDLVHWSPVYTNQYLTPFNFTDADPTKPIKFYRRR